MFWNAAQAVTKTKSSLLALKESPNHQKAPEAQVKTTKKPGCWSRVGKFRVGTKKTHGFDHMGHTTKKRRTTTSTSKKINPYVLRNQEPKIEEAKQAKQQIFNWKMR